MRVAVTGAAGFIGSHLCEALLAAGHDVLGIDSLTGNYDPAIKRANLAALTTTSRFAFRRADLATDAIAPLLKGRDVVFHLAGAPGVRTSWGNGLAAAVEGNLVAFDRLLRAAAAVGVGRVVWASSSSVYGTISGSAAGEADRPAPASPYAVTKRAAEFLAAQAGVPTVGLRYFTVYGPRQRPDMALHRLCAAVTGGPSFPLYGSGRQRRDLTYVSDVVRATVLAGTAEVEPGEVLNVAGGRCVSVAELIEKVGEVAGRRVPVVVRPAAHGDVAVTAARTCRARERLGWVPEVDLDTGIAAQLAWHRERRRTSTATCAHRTGPVVVG